MSAKPRIGFAGLGAMGGGMAANLVRHGFAVTGFDLSRPLVEALVAAGGHAAATPREAAAAADVLISMVATAAQNERFLFGGGGGGGDDDDDTAADAAVHGLGPDATFMLCSTTAPAFPPALRRRLDAAGRPDVRVLDCPVSGGTLRAAAGTLSVFAAGPPRDLDAVRAILAALSAHLYRVGPLAHGAKTKTAHQLLAATNIAAAAEAMGLAARAGLDTRAAAAAVDRSPGASFMFANRAPHMLAGDWRPLSALAIILKDTRIVVETAAAAGFPAPLAAAAHALYLAGARAGLLPADDARLVQLYLPATRGDLVARMADADVPRPAPPPLAPDAIVDLLAGVHLAASVEAMAFARHLGMDARQMHDIVCAAAGANAMFGACVPAMLPADRWTLADCAEAPAVGRKLAAVVARCAALAYPCPMAAAALQQFHFAALARVPPSPGDAERGDADGRSL